METFCLTTLHATLLVFGIIALSNVRDLMNYLSNVTEQVHTLSGASPPALSFTTPPLDLNQRIHGFFTTHLTILPKSDSVPNISTKVTEGTRNVS